MFSSMNKEILPNCLKGKQGYSLGECSNTTSVAFGAEMVNSMVSGVLDC